MRNDQSSHVSHRYTCPSVLWTPFSPGHQQILGQRPVAKYNRKRAKKTKLYFHTNTKSSKERIPFFFFFNNHKGFLKLKLSPQSVFHRAVACRIVLKNEAIAKVTEAKFLELVSLGTGEKVS